MVEFRIKNNTGKPYEEVRDMICKSLIGNKGFIENDIVVSDQYKDENTICIVLGDEDNNFIVDAVCSIDHMQITDLKTGEVIPY